MHKITESMTMNRDNRLFHIAPFIIIALGIAARLYDVTYNFDGDELASFKLASKPFAKLFEDWPHEAHPPLHIFLLHIWIKVFGSSEAVARSLSIFASGLFLFSAYHVLRRLVTEWLALGLLLLLAISPMFVYFGQQARPFSLLALFTALNMLAFMQMAETPSVTKKVIAWMATCVLLIYTQYQSVVLIALECVLIIVFLKAYRIKLISLAIVSVAVVLPWVVFVMGSAVSHGENPMPNISWIQIPTFSEYLWFYIYIFGSVPVLQARWLLIALFVLSLFYLRQIHGSKKFPLDQLFIVVSGVGLITLVFLVSVWGPKPVFAYRHLIGAAFACVALIGLCLESLPQGYGKIATSLLLVWTAAALPGNLPHDIKPPWREVGKYIDESHGEILVLVPEIWVKSPLEHYRESGSVVLWDDFEKHASQDRNLLFVCRPKRCLDNLNDLHGYQKTLDASWDWGRNYASSRNLKVFMLTKN